MGSPVISVPTEEIVAKTNKKPGFRETGPFSSHFTLSTVVQEVITQLFVLLLVPIHINPQTTRGHFSNRKNPTPIVNKPQTRMGSFHLPLSEFGCTPETKAGETEQYFGCRDELREITLGISVASDEWKN